MSDNLKQYRHFGTVTVAGQAVWALFACRETVGGQLKIVHQSLHTIVLHVFIYIYIYINNKTATITTTTQCKLQFVHIRLCAR